MTQGSYTKWLASPLLRDNSNHRIQQGIYSSHQSRMSLDRWLVDFVFIFRLQRFLLSQQLSPSLHVCKSLFLQDLPLLFQLFIFPFFYYKSTVMFAGIIFIFVKLLEGSDSSLIPFLSMIRLTLGKMSFDYSLD
jgi:hypothetical protein